MDFLRRAVLATIACSWLFLSGCGNTFRPIANPLPLQPGNPQLADMVAVLNVNPNTNNVPDATGSLTVFSVSGDTNVGNYVIGANNTLATATPPVNPLTSRLITFGGGDSFIATADAQTHTVTLIDTVEGTTTTISLPQDLNPTFITATATTGLILVSLQEVSPASTTPTCPGGRGAIGIITAEIATLTSTICPASSSSGFIPGFILITQSDSEAFILDPTDNSISALNLSTLSPSSMTSVVGTVGTTPIWATLSLDGNTIYVLNQGTHDISVIDAVGQSVTTLSIASAALGTNPSVIITDRNFNRLYISNTGSNTVSVLDANSATLPALHAPIAVGTAPVALSVTPDGTSVYVANTGSGFVSVINGNSFNVTTLTPDTTDPSPRVQSVTVSKDGTKAFIAITTGGDLANGTYVVLTSNNSLVINPSGGPLNIAPPQDLSCDVTETCAGVLLQRPVQVVPRI